MFESFRSSSCGARGGAGINVGDGSVVLGRKPEYGSKVVSWGYVVVVVVVVVVVFVVVVVVVVVGGVIASDVFAFGFGGV